MGELFGWTLLATYALLMGLRIVLARRWWSPPPATGTGTVVVLQPIRSGDASLAQQLATNVANHPQARFRWLIDTDDPDAEQVCTALAASPAAAGRVEVRRFEPPPPLMNPKTHKLARAIEADDHLIAVLDDDTVLLPGSLARAEAALASADLVTGVPYYLDLGGLWSRLTAAFVNGSSLITYPAMAALGPPVTINGMFYLTSTAALSRAGGFAGIETKVCDDYEIAAAYRRAGLKLAQTAIAHPLHTEVRSVGDYWTLQRRWLVFAQHQLSRETNPLLTIGIGLPSLLPLAILVLAAVSGSVWLAASLLITLLAKAFAMAWLRQQLLDIGTRVGAVALEVIADLSTPVVAVAALVPPGRIIWRGRRMRLLRNGTLGR